MIRCHVTSNDRFVKEPRTPHICENAELDDLLVPTARLELARLSPLPPQDSVSTNFTTSALLKRFADFQGIKLSQRSDKPQIYRGISFAFDSPLAGVDPGAAPASAGAEEEVDSTTLFVTLSTPFGLLKAT